MHVLCISECYHQMGLYTREPLVGGKKIMRVLNHYFLFLFEVQGER